MDKVWISALIGALTGGFTSTTCILLMSLPLWSILVVYPLVGLLTTAVIMGVWTRLEADDCATEDNLADVLFRADTLVK